MNDRKWWYHKPNLRLQPQKEKVREKDKELSQVYTEFEVPVGASKQKPDTQERFLDPEIQESSTYLAVKVMGLSK